MPTSSGLSLHSRIVTGGRVTLSRSLTLASLAALAVPVFAADGERPRETVSVGGFAIEPMGNMTSPDSAVTIHPKALVGVAYNTNVYATENNTESDVFYSAIAGIDIGWRATEEDKFLLSGEYVGQAYQEQQGRNLQGGRGIFRYGHKALVWDANALASFARTNDPFISTGEQIKHDDLDGAINASRTGNFIRVGAGGTYSRRDYLEGSAQFGENDRDYTIVGGNMRAGYLYAEDSEAYVRGFVDRRNYDEDVFNDSTGYGGLVGVMAKIATRSQLIAEIGATYRAYKDDFRGIASYDDKNLIAPVGNLIYRWRPEIGSHVGARIYSSLEDSITSNGAWLVGGVLDGRFRLQKQAALYGSAGVYRLTSSGHAPGAETEVRTTEELTVGAEYFLMDGVGLRLQNVYTMSQSKTLNDFSRDVVSLDLGFVY
ncbi:MAG: outer membrane beta-barrel protein [Planctomycetes bacterium]|nr:outer membrane beta-barrel protein [Planctomycetota bacterium]